MMSVFTKYNRPILAVLSALLLVVFLAPTAVTQCGRMDASPSTVWATTSDGASVTLKDLTEMRGQLAVLEFLRDPISTRLDVTKSADHWWLLVKEARDAGMVGGISDGREFLEQAAASTGRPADELLVQLSASSRQPQQVVLQALANLRGVERLIRASHGPDAGADATLPGMTAEPSAPLLTHVLGDLHALQVPIPYPMKYVTVLIDRPRGGPVTMIDTALDTPEARQAIEDGLGALGLHWSDVDRVIITHHRAHQTRDKE